ncbi:hypothetical protein PMAYCL1PPCAC_05623 [Pristionchus mayeri]|uniref:Protein kinase domain-containing protein n=1 Tax=Pristionchus mayeri TaxID=1317129 RepID=A0AAN4ZBD0_9BILA|nr:hypothetical protein PMAYCL1PPCAC_05623 [Pristionchus mayeri]
MMFLPTIKLKGATIIWYIAGINNNEIVAHAEIEDDHCLVTAQRSSGQPLGHYTNGIFDGSSRFASEFRISQILGVGGFGIVFEVQNRLDGRAYAVKRIPVNPDEEQKVLEGEVKAMAKFDHPGIVR